jgi:hypothetical protein
LHQSHLSITSINNSFATTGGGGGGVPIGNDHMCNFDVSLPPVTLTPAVLCFYAQIQVRIDMITCFFIFLCLCLHVQLRRFTATVDADARCALFLNIGAYVIVFFVFLLFFHMC